MPETVVLQVDALAVAPENETAADRADRLERLRTLRAIAVQTAQLDALGQVRRPPARHSFAPGALHAQLCMRWMPILSKRCVMSSKTIIGQLDACVGS